jgi:hypothetical protein
MIDLPIFSRGEHRQGWLCDLVGLWHVCDFVVRDGLFELQRAVPNGPETVLDEPELI